MTKVIWKGEPILFTNQDNTKGLMVGKYVYLFTKEGHLDACIALTRQHAERVAAIHFPKPAPALAAYCRPLYAEKRNANTDKKGSTGPDNDKKN